MTNNIPPSNLVGQNKNLVGQKSWYNYVGRLKMKNFGTKLREKRLERGLSQDDLAKKAKISKGYISTLERNQPHTITGAPPRPTVEKVERLAEALEWDLDEALTSAGFASENKSGYPETENELVEAMKRFGIENFKLSKADMEKVSSDFFRSIIESFENSIRGKIQKIKEGENIKTGNS